MNCDFTDLANAIQSAANEDILQLEAETFTGQSGVNFNIVSKSLELRGGFEPGCTGVRSTAPTSLQGQGADSVIEISGSGSHFVVLSQLLIFDGTDDADYGGGLEIDDAFSVLLSDVDVALNESELGGGIHIDGTDGASVLIFDESRIRLNNALRLDTSDPVSGSGGGIFCQNDAVVEIADGSSVADNHAGRHGGGVFASSNCDVRLLQSSGVPGTASIENNEATQDGGGAFVTDGAHLVADGGSDAASWIRANVAGSSGGGIYVTGASSLASGESLHIAENQADSGGGVYVADDAFLDLEGDACLASRCVEVVGNESVFGAAVAVVSGAQAEIERTWITDNLVTVANGSGAAGFAASGGDLELWSSMIVGNRTVSGLGEGAIFSSSGVVDLLSSTFTGQENVENIVAGSGDLRIENSIFWDNHDDDPVDLTWSGTFTGDCLVIPPLALLPVGATNVHTDDPLFVDPTGGDPHLSEDSPAIDLCAATVGSRDIDYHPRPAGIRADAGGDEHIPPIFTDGFESGDTSAWTITID